MNEIPIELTRESKVCPGGIVAARDISLTIVPGETLALFGPNGAGKTTTIRLILGLAKPSSGVVRVFGRDPRDAPARMRIGTMLQIAEIPASLTVREHVTLFSSYYPHPLPIDETLRLAAIDDLANRRSERLSGGQRQRLPFAIAICGDPDLLVLDEPTASLDRVARRPLGSDSSTRQARQEHHFHHALPRRSRCAGRSDCVDLPRRDRCRRVTRRD